MPDGRMLSKSIAHSEQCASVSFEADYLFTRCIPHLDKEGRMSGRPEIVKSITCPLRGEITAEMIPELLQELGEAGLVKWYKIEKNQYLEFPGFPNHQKGARFGREAASRVPPSTSSDATDLVRINSGVGPDPLRHGIRQSRSEVKLSEVEVEVARVREPSTIESDSKTFELPPPTTTETTEERLRQIATSWASNHLSEPRRKTLIAKVDRLSTLDATVWHTDDGSPAPEAERPRMLEYALSMIESGESKDIRSAIRYAIKTQLGAPLPRVNGGGPNGSKPYPQHQERAPNTLSVAETTERQRRQQRGAEEHQRLVGAWRERREAAWRSLSKGEREKLRKAAEDMLGAILKRASPEKREQTVHHSIFVTLGHEAGDPYPTEEAAK